ncbi:TlpA disulfide reductase family protein [Gelidibacter sp.]|uniref:TlpA disulfide reductase family protein n=1 Tax=Gelidibacter sp. TaxID=2018083 RepID=UPI002B70F207|nr:TlpA disulfide reductase family protein [Gelidibacter sp.]HUH27571.1 TlpA disulfide reductase family protein [Gelidibacter sp.]
MKFLLIILSVFTLVSCNKDYSKKMQHGHWLGELQVTDDEILPFNFEVTADKSLKILNAKEVILVDDITYKNDSIFIKMPVFGSYFALKLTKEGMVGSFINEGMDTKMPFKAIYGSKDRFEVKETPTANISGNWEVAFTPETGQETYVAKGIFQQKEQKVTGTFRTQIGDYRFLEGVITGNKLKMSAFDGSHAFLFVATVTDSILNGVFYSGNNWRATFEGNRNEHFELPDATTLTTLQHEEASFDFSFPDDAGQTISLADAQFQNKVVVVQLMGTWCPNCLDESTFFSEYSKLNSEKDVEFVALAFENAKTDSLAFEGIKRLKDRLGIEYPVLLAQYGTADKIEAQKKLPMLKQVVSYPTTVFIDKTGKVRKIHTGFNGPATGEKYVQFKNEFRTFVDKLLQE